MSNLVEIYNTTLVAMLILAVVIFIALQFVEAGYGYLSNSKFGVEIPNRVGWIAMEAPVFVAMLSMWVLSEREVNETVITLTLLFLTHYFQRSFIFPLLIKGRSKIPVSIVAMGVVFNLINAFMQGGWLFYIAPEGFYDGWFAKPYIYIGVVIFLIGMLINLHSDYIIRNLRKEGDTRHYIPRGGMFRYVSSANYFGELLEWCGFAIACCSYASVIFLLWTFANLAPRARSINRRYAAEFGAEFKQLKLKSIIPFIY